MVVKQCQVQQICEVTEIEDQLQRTTEEQLTSFKNLTANVPEMGRTHARHHSDFTLKFGTTDSVVPLITEGNSCGNAVGTTGNHICTSKNESTHFP